MKFEDPSVLSGYLDGELDPALRRQVEMAAQSSSRISYELDRLSQVRDALQGLPTPVLPRDVSSRVVNTLDQMDSRRLGIRERRWRVGRLWISLGGIAACLALAVSLHLLDRPDGSWRMGASDVGKLASNAARPLGKPLATISASSAESADRQLESSLVAGDPPAIIPSEWDRLARSRDRLRDLLGTSEARRLLISVRESKPDDEERVETALLRVPRANSVHARLWVARGLDLDPSLAETTSVYAVRLDQTEFENLRDDLASVFGASALQVDAVPSSTLALLAETGQPTFFEVPARGTLVANTLNSQNTTSLRVGPAKAELGHVAILPLGHHGMAWGLVPDFLTLRTDRFDAFARAGNGPPRGAFGPRMDNKTANASDTRQRVSAEIVTQSLEELVAHWQSIVATSKFEHVGIESRQVRVYLVWLTSQRPGA